MNLNRDELLRIIVLRRFHCQTLSFLKILNVLLIIS